METKFIEAHGNGFNWGKFMIARFTHEEWHHKSEVRELNSGETSIFGMNDIPLLRSIGWDPKHIIVFDLQTCEGAAFRPGGYAKYDLNKHKVWVCPLFEPFLDWLYKQDLKELHKLPALVELPDAPSALAGYRREGAERVKWMEFARAVIRGRLPEDYGKDSVALERLAALAREIIGEDE